MLNSRAVASVLESSPGVFTLCIRQDYEENLGHYSFSRWRQTFDSEHKAMIFYKKNWPQGAIVPFDDLIKAQ